MLDWHYNHVTYEEGGPFLIRQHAAAVLAAISSIGSPVGSEVTVLLGDILHDCCCNWFHKATRFGVKEVSEYSIIYVMYFGIYISHTFLNNDLTKCVLLQCHLKKNPIFQFSQATLLSSCLNAVTWYIRHTDTVRYQNFINNYLSEFIKSHNFVKFINTIR